MMEVYRDDEENQSRSRQRLDWAPKAREELTRRGSNMPTLTVSNHAIDRASQRLLPLWISTRKDDNEGLHSWLMRVATVAFQQGERLSPKAGDDPDAFTVKHQGITFAFQQGWEFPVLKTVVVP